MRTATSFGQYLRERGLVSVRALDEAVRWQRQAVEKNKGHKEIDSTLNKYLAEQTASSQDI